MLLRRYWPTGASDQMSTKFSKRNWDGRYVGGIWNSSEPGFSDVMIIWRYGAMKMKATR